MKKEITADGKREKDSGSDFLSKPRLGTIAQDLKTRGRRGCSQRGIMKGQPRERWWGVPDHQRKRRPFVGFRKLPNAPAGRGPGPLLLRGAFKSGAHKKREGKG